MTSAIVLLRCELDKWETALAKSKIAFKEGQIDSALHETHVKNITPQIAHYKEAITILENATKNMNYDPDRTTTTGS